LRTANRRAPPGAFIPLMRLDQCSRIPCVG